MGLAAALGGEGFGVEHVAVPGDVVLDVHRQIGQSAGGTVARGAHGDELQLADHVVEVHLQLHELADGHAQQKDASTNLTLETHAHRRVPSGVGC